MKNSQFGLILFIYLRLQMCLGVWLMVWSSVEHGGDCFLISNARVDEQTFLLKYCPHWRYIDYECNEWLL